MVGDSPIQFTPKILLLDPIGEHIANCMGPTVDMQLGREILGEAILAATILNTDKAWRDSLRAIVPRLAPLQISPSTGALQEWLEDYKEAEPEHRHTSHLMGVYPLDEITPWETPAFQKRQRWLWNGVKKVVSGGHGPGGWHYMHECKTATSPWLSCVLFNAFKCYRDRL